MKRSPRLRRIRAAFATLTADHDKVSFDDALVEHAPETSVIHIFRRFWPTVKPYSGWLLLSVVFIAVSAVLSAVSIWMYKVLVDRVLVPHQFSMFWPIAAAYIVISIFEGLVGFGQTYLSTLVSERFVLNLRTSFFRHLMRLSIDFFDRHRLGDVLSRIGGDIRTIEDLTVSGLRSAASNVFRFIFYAAATFYLRWDLALAAFVVVPPFWVVSRYFSRRIRLVSREQRRRSGSVTSLAEESISNIAVVQIHNREEHEVRRFNRQGEANFAVKLTSAKLRAYFSPLIEISNLIASLLVIGMGIWEVTAGRLSIGGILAFLAYVSQLYSPIRGITRLINRWHSAAAGAERVIEFFDEVPAVKESETPAVLGRASGRVELQNVSFRYSGAARVALEDASFSLQPGEALAVVGRSGAGKSTLAKLLLRLYDPEAGRVLLDGIDLRELKLSNLRENITMLPQEPMIFDTTIRENIAYGMTCIGKRDAIDSPSSRQQVGDIPDGSAGRDDGGTAGDDAIIEAAKAADADDFIRGLPEGYDTIVGQKGRLLSGGQRQRIGIARAMVRNTPVLVLDEPTTGIDAGSADRIIAPLRRLMAGRTTIIISHELHMVSWATRIAMLEEGRVVGLGPHEELLETCPQYEKLYRLHAGEELGTGVYRNA